MNEEENKTLDQQEQEVVSTVQRDYCAQCGAELAQDQVFCPKCGHKKGDSIATEKDGRTGSKKALIAGSVLAVVVLIALFFGMRGAQAKDIVLNKENITMKVGENVKLTFTINPDNTKNKEVTWTSSNDSISNVDSGTVQGVKEGTCTITVKTANGKTDTCSVIVEPAGPNLVEIFNESCNPTWASVASDGSYLSIDTNPTDSKYGNKSENDAILGIFAVNEALGLPESVINKMGKTRAMDGMQSARGEGVEISWTYHPDNGLEIIYSLTD